MLPAGPLVRPIGRGRSCSDEWEATAHAYHKPGGILFALDALNT